MGRAGRDDHALADERLAGAGVAQQVFRPRRRISSGSAIGEPKLSALAISRRWDRPWRCRRAISVAMLRRVAGWPTWRGFMGARSDLSVGREQARCREIVPWPFAILAMRSAVAGATTIGRPRAQGGCARCRTPPRDRTVGKYALPRDRADRQRRDEILRRSLITARTAQTVP